MRTIWRMERIMVLRGRRGNRNARDRGGGAIRLAGRSVMSVLGRIAIGKAHVMSVKSFEDRANNRVAAGLLPVPAPRNNERDEIYLSMVI